jgi:hypothetical protein
MGLLLSSLEKEFVKDVQPYEFLLCGISELHSICKVLSLTYRVDGELVLVWSPRAIKTSIFPKAIGGPVIVLPRKRVLVASPVTWHCQQQCSLL